MAMFNSYVKLPEGKIPVSVGELTSFPRSSLDLPQLWRLRSVQRQMRCLLDLRLTLEPGRTTDLRMNREFLGFP